MKLVSYVRVSSQRQASEGDSIEGQRIQINDWAKANNHEIVMEYCDSGFSAFNGVRHEFKRMISDAVAESPTFEGIVTYNLSRFSRNNLEMLQTKHVLDLANIKLFSVNDQIPEDRKTARLVTALFGAINENQSEQNSETVRDRLTETAKAGFHTGGRTLFGYKSIVAPKEMTSGQKDRKILVVDTEEAEIVKRLFSLSLNGNNGLPMGIKAIATLLNREGVKFRGGQWNYNNVDRLLRETSYYGIKIFGKCRDNKTPKYSQVPVKVPSIVSKEIFDAVGLGLTQRRPGTHKSKGISNPTLLTGILKCAECGAGFRLSTGKSGKYRYYTCGQKLARDVDSCSAPRIPKDKIESAIINVLKKRILTPERLGKITTFVRSKNTTDKNNVNHEILLCNKKIVGIKEKADNLWTLISEKKITFDDTLSTHMDNLQKQIKTLELKVEKAKIEASLKIWNYGSKQIEQFIGDSFDTLASSRPEAVKAYLASIINEIRVHKKSVKVVGGNYPLVDIISRSKKMGTSNEVPTYFTIWRRERDSNPR
ncbi:recombinase family protein [Paraglaciecola sp. 20A4]|uniref:recombinase family protein n=1 Tax=Paraglaciecola sp. 20A4 TaxID=2687288 RepID=UPI00140E0C87|nr:recombinase family protein [Paraglaciecola sp. 20A4]